MTAALDVKIDDAVIQESVEAAVRNRLRFVAADGATVTLCQLT